MLPHSLPVAHHFYSSIFLIFHTFQLQNKLHNEPSPVASPLEARTAQPPRCGLRAYASAPECVFVKHFVRSGAVILRGRNFRAVRVYTRARTHLGAQLSVPHAPVCLCAANLSNRALVSARSARAVRAESCAYAQSKHK